MGDTENLRAAVEDWYDPDEEDLLSVFINKEAD